VLKTTITSQDGQLIVARSQDCQPVLEHVAAMKELTDQTGDLRYVGEIPHVIIEKYLNERGISFHEFMQGDEHIKRILNSSDYKKLRVWEGRF
jgi:hypothetical protein